jgi:hypothetical protein
MEKTNKQPFILNTLTGTWENVNFNPTVMIYRNGDTHLVSFISMKQTGKPALTPAKSSRIAASFISVTTTRGFQSLTMPA